MKNVKMSMLLLSAVLLLLASCKKEEKDTLKKLEGEWNITSVYTDGAIDPRTIEGTWTFDDCKLKDNKERKCTGHYNYSVTYMGSTQNVDASFTYKVLGSSRILIDADELSMSLDENKMLLDFTDSSPNVMINFEK